MYILKRISYLQRISLRRFSYRKTFRKLFWQLLLLLSQLQFLFIQQNHGTLADITV